MDKKQYMPIIVIGGFLLFLGSFSYLSSLNKSNPNYKKFSNEFKVRIKQINKTSKTNSKLPSKPN